ncbi:MAG: DUF4838 domain-containing protein [Phycisphaerae bacterium]|jgi:hypothetical protein
MNGMRKNYPTNKGFTIRYFVPLVLLFLAAMMWILWPSPPELLLAENGMACMDIVVPDNACYVVKMASEELREFLNKSTGADFKVVTESKLAGNKGLFLGNTRAFSRRAGIADFESQQYVIKIEKDAVFIAGKDDPRTATIDLLTLLHYVRDKSTLYGVYSFLENYCGTRFFAPGEIGQFVPLRRRLAIKQGQVLEKPYFSERNIADFTGYSMAKYPDAPAYLTKSNDEIMVWGLRLKLSAKGSAAGCHSEQFFTKFFTKTHPEYFSLQPDGTRNFRYFCWSNPTVIELWEKMADAYFSGKTPASADPALKELKNWTGCFFPDEFMVDPMDNYEKFICQCPDCQKAIAGRGELGAGELIFAAINKITANVALKHPGKYITTTVYPPKKIFPKDSVIHNNLLVKYCYIIGPEQQAFEKDYSAELDLLRQWSRAKGGKLPVWTYIDSFKFGDVIPGLPDTCLHGFSRFLGDVADYASGLFVEHYTPTLAMRSLDNYIEAKLLWNPSLDVDVLLEEYINNFYGPARIPIKAFFDRLEINCRCIMEAIAKETRPEGATATDNTKGLYHNRKYWQKFAWENIYSPSEMNLLDQLLTEAEKNANSSGDAICKKRVALLRDFIYMVILKERNKSVTSGLRANLVMNPGLERSGQDELEYWTLFPSKSELSAITVDNAESHSGKSSLRISQADADSFSVCKQNIPVEPGTNYTVTCWMKGENIVITNGCEGAHVLIGKTDGHGIKGAAIQQGSFPWKKTTMTFNSGPENTVSLHLYLHRSTGDVWYDDIEMVKGLE